MDSLYKLNLRENHYSMKYSIILILALSIHFSCDVNLSQNFGGVSRGGSTATFATAGNTLYVIEESRLHTYDISNKNEIEFLNSIFLNTFLLETIFPFGDYLYIGSATGMFIVDISNPQAPKYVSDYVHVVSCDPVVTDGDFAYVTLRSGNNCGQTSDELQIIDVSNVSGLKLVTTYAMTSPKGLAINNDTLYVADRGIRVLDVSDKNDIRELAFVPNIPANDVIYHNQKLLVTTDNGFFQFDVSDLDNITQIGQFDF